MKQEDTKKMKDEQQRSAHAGWDNEGGAAPSESGRQAEIEWEARVVRNAGRAAFDTTHDSSARGEHRYPDTHQTEREQNARTDRDALKRKLGGTS
jgi:hypothetical protein